MYLDQKECILTKQLLFFSPMEAHFLCERIFLTHATLFDIEEPTSQEKGDWHEKTFELCSPKFNYHPDKWPPAILISQLT